jgi:peptide/nickel transport system substrate-binding protein
VAVVAAAALVVGATLAACSPSAPSDNTDTRLTMLSPEPSQGLDPNLAFADASRIPMAMIYETLIERDEKGAFVGSLASDWKVSDDALTYTFTLRDDSAFSDGSAITAADVVFSLERAQQGAVLGGNLTGVTVAADGDKNVVLTLTTPSTGLLTALATPGSAGILSKAAVEAGGDAYFTKPTATSGPWSMEEYIPKSRATFVANPHYYNPPKVKTIDYTFSEDQTTHSAAIQSGTADIAGIGYADAQTLKADSGNGIQVVEVDQLAPLFWGWDRTKAPFDDKLVRQAVAWAVDREGRIDACWFGTGATTYGNILRPWDPAYAEIDTYKAANRDEAVAKAEALLDEAGWVDDGSGTRAKNGTKLEVTVPYEGNWPAAECHVQLLQHNLADVGIAVTPESYDASAYWGDVSKNAFTMYHGGAGAIDAADLYFNWFDSKGTLTALTTHLNDPRIDAQVEKARSATDPEEAAAIYHDLEEWQADELPMLVVGYQWPQTALGPRVQNWTPHVDSDSRWLVGVSVTD